MEINWCLVAIPISKLVWGVSALESQAVWAPWLSQNLFIAYILAVGSSNPLLVHSLIVWQLSPYVRTNRNHKQTWILNSGCTPLACAFKHQKSRLSPLYPNDPPLMTFLSSNLENKQILFSLHWCWVVWSWFLQMFLRFW